jgi:hypothetical protein
VTVNVRQKNHRPRSVKLTCCRACSNARRSGASLALVVKGCVAIGRSLRPGGLPWSAKLYARICRKWGPRGMTLSAWLWARELEGKGYFLRELVDDTFMCFFDQYDHCAESYRRETAIQRGFQ